MAYIYTDHHVGAVRYVYDSESDTVHRVTITKIGATCTEPGLSPEFHVSYFVAGKSNVTFVMDGKDLHRTAADAFAQMPEEPASDEPAQA